MTRNRVEAAIHNKSNQKEKLEKIKEEVFLIFCVCILINENGIRKCQQQSKQPSFTI